MKLLALIEMYDLEAKNDPSIVFHGTSSCYAPEIETSGWKVDSRPFDWKDIKFVIELCERLNIGCGAFLYHNYSSQYQKRPQGSGAYFTY